MTPSMAALGFVVTAYLRDSEMLRGYEMYLAHWTNRACGQSAALIVLSGPAGIVARATSMQFKTRLANGTTVVTDNSNQARILVFEQDYHLLQFPDVDDPAELYQLHLWHEERRLDPKLPRFLPAEQKLLDNMKREIKRTFSTQVAAGRMKERNGRYHHTLENAFRLTWKHLPPFRQIAKARTTLKANRIKRQALNGTLRRPLPVITTDVQLVGSSD
jgi:hypothetical protein